MAVGTFLPVQGKEDNPIYFLWRKREGLSSLLISELFHARVVVYGLAGYWVYWYYLRGNRRDSDAGFTASTRDDKRAR